MRNAGLILIWVTVCIQCSKSSMCLTRDTYPVVKDGKTLTCWLCQPGTKFVNNCPLDNTTAICASCDGGTFESCYNKSPFCADCTPVCPPRFEHVPTCNATHDNTCECQDGMYRKDSHSCLTHTICQPGEQIQTLGTKYKNTECVPCPRETYSTTENSSQCRKCRVCTGNQKVKTNCTGNSDSVCTENKGETVPTTNGDVGSPPILAIACIAGIAGVGLLATGVSIWCYIKRRSDNSGPQRTGLEMGNLLGIPDADAVSDLAADAVSDLAADAVSDLAADAVSDLAADAVSDLAADAVSDPVADAVNNDIKVSSGNGTDMHTSDSVREGYGQVSTPDRGREGATSSDTGSNSDSDTPTEASGQGVDHLKNQVDQDVSANLRKQEVLRCRAEICTDEMILWLKDKIPIKKKSFIFCRLLNKYAVEEQEEMYPKNIPLQVLNLLYKWRDKLGPDATADKLVNALVEEGCKKVANEFKKEFKLHDYGLCF